MPAHSPELFVRFLHRFALALGALLLSVILLVEFSVDAKAATTSASPYECQPRDPNIATPPPIVDMPGNSGPAIAASVQSDHFHPLCAEGEVPYPTAASGITAPKILPQIPTTSPEEATAGATARTVSRSSHNSPKLTGTARHHRSRKGPKATAARSSIVGYW
jgi:hypothetical protein